MLPALPREEGFVWDVALLLEDAILFAQPCEFLALGGHQPGTATRPIGPRPRGPVAQGGLRPIEIARRYAASAIGLDIFALIREMSTESDQADA